MPLFLYTFLNSVANANCLLMLTVKVNRRVAYHVCKIKIHVIQKSTIGTCAEKVSLNFTTQLLHSK